MVIVGHMSSKSAFGAKNTGQKFLTPKNFWWCRNVCPDSCPGVIFGAGRGGAGQSWKFSGPGRPGAAISPGAGAGQGGACIPAIQAKWRRVRWRIYLRGFFSFWQGGDWDHFSGRTATCKDSIFIILNLLPPWSPLILVIKRFWLIWAKRCLLKKWTKW